MRENRKIIVVVICIAIVVVLLISGSNLRKAKLNEFKALEEQVQRLEETTLERIAKGVVTIPEGNIVVGLDNYIGTYKSIGGSRAKVEIQSKFLKTQFIAGSYGKQNPRQDAIVPMYIDTDSLGGSTYIILFNDRGDTVIEKSYARIGGKNASVTAIDTLLADGNTVSQEYRVSIKYTIGSEVKEVIIPVVDGHFNPENTISK